MKNIFNNLSTMRPSQRRLNTLRTVGYIFVVTSAIMGIYSGFSGYFLSTEDYFRITAAMYSEAYVKSVALEKLSYNLEFSSHVIIGCIYIFMAIYQFNLQARRRSPRLHRFVGKLFVICGALTGITGLYVGIVMPFAGILEQAFITITSLWFLYALYLGYSFARHRKFLLHREWMIRSFAVALAAAAMRFPLIIMNQTLPFDPMTLFILAAGSTNLVVLVVAEWWIHITRPVGAITRKKQIGAN